MTIMPRRYYPGSGGDRLTQALSGPDLPLNCEQASCNNNLYARSVFDDAGLGGPIGHAASKEAKRICHECPIIAECRAYALRNAEPWGVWGGMTLVEREHAIALIEEARAKAAVRRVLEREMLGTDLDSAVSA